MSSALLIDSAVPNSVMTLGGNTYINGELVTPTNGNVPGTQTNVNRTPLIRERPFTRMGTVAGVTGGVASTGVLTLGALLFGKEMLDGGISFAKETYYDRMPWLNPENGYSSKTDWEQKTGRLADETTGKIALPETDTAIATGHEPSVHPDSTLLSVLRQNSIDSTLMLHELRGGLNAVAQSIEPLYGYLGLMAQTMYDKIEIDAIQNFDTMELMRNNNDILVKQLFDMMQIDAIQNADIVSAIQNINISTGGRTEDEIALTSLKKQQIEYDITAQDIRDLDGNVVANMSPAQAKATQAINQARKDTDTNNFELDNNDFDMFSMPDISAMFTPEKKTDRLQAVMDELNNS